MTKVRKQSPGKKKFPKSPAKKPGRVRVTLEAFQKRASQERKSPHHDILVINPDRELFRIPVEKSGSRAGRFVTTPQDVSDVTTKGRRKVLRAIAPPEREPAHGIAFATLPVKPEPASAHFSCYLINAPSLNYRNPWITADWTGAPDDHDPEPMPDADAKIEVLIAAGNGSVYYVEIKPDGSGELVSVQARGANGSAGVREVDLRPESELWQALRNGAVAGAVRYVAGDARVVPLVNISSLQPGTTLSKELRAKRAALKDEKP